MCLFFSTGSKEYLWKLIKSPPRKTSKITNDPLIIFNVVDNAEIESPWLQQKHLKSYTAFEAQMCNSSNFGFDWKLCASVSARGVEMRPGKSDKSR